jgi:hypothetical protein
MIVHFKSSKTIFLIVRLNRRRRFSIQWLSFVIVSHSSWLFRFWFVFALSRSYHWMICADFKTIKSFCRKISKWSCLFVKWSQNDHVFSNRTFWIFSHFWSSYFVLNSCERKWHSAVIESTIRKTWWWWSRRVMMINENDDQFFFTKRKNAFVLLFLDFMTRLLRAFSCSLWSSFLVFLAEVTVRSVSENCLLWKDSCILENVLFLTINRSSSVSFSKNRRCRRRLFKLRWDVWSVTARS